MKSLRITMAVLIISIFIIAFSTLAALNFIQAKKVIQDNVQYNLEKTAEY